MEDVIINEIPWIPVTPVNFLFFFANHQKVPNY